MSGTVKVTFIGDSSNLKKLWQASTEKFPGQNLVFPNFKTVFLPREAPR